MYYTDGRGDAVRPHRLAHCRPAPPAPGHWPPGAAQLAGRAHGLGRRHVVADAGSVPSLAFACTWPRRPAGESDARQSMTHRYDRFINVLSCYALAHYHIRCWICICIIFHSTFSFFLFYIFLVSHVFLNEDSGEGGFPFAISALTTFRETHFHFLHHRRE